MTIDNTVPMLIASTARIDCRDEPDLIVRITKAMRAAQRSWMNPSDDQGFRGAIAAVLLETTDEAEKQRIERSLRQVKQINAIMVAAQAGLAVNVDGMEMPEPDNIPLLKMWSDVKAANVE